MTTHQPIKLAFIGGGKTSAVGYVHFIAAQMDNNFQVVAGAFCRTKEDNILTGKQWGVAAENCHPSWQDLIEQEKERVDAFVVLTPTPDHLEILIALLAENLPIICEKALLTGPSQVSQLKKHYNPEKHFLAVTFNYTGYAMIRELRARIAAGELGLIQKIQLEMPQEGFRRPPDIAGKTAPPQAWRLKDGEIPTICLDLGVHLHHMTYYLLGQRPTDVIATFRNDSDYQGIVDDVNLLANYSNNISGHMWFSKTAIGNRNGLKVRVFGDKGSAEWLQTNPDELLLNLSDGSRQIIDRGHPGHIIHDWQYNRMKPGHPAGFIEAFANLYMDIAVSLRAHIDKQGQSPKDYCAEIAYSGLEFFAAAKKSSQNKQWIDLTDT